MTPRHFFQCVPVCAIAAAALVTVCSSAQQSAPQPSDDKYLWLEDVSSARSLDWVRAEDARSLKTIEADPHYAELHAAALKVEESPDRLPQPELRGGAVYNFWQDAQHVNGILRKTTPADYATANPHWHTVLDIDALGKKDGVAWVFQGLDCLYPGDHYCLVHLSAGGEDAETVREFDLQTEAFVEGGFHAPHGKQNVAWVDKDTLLIARDWGPGSMTPSGYPFIVKQWKRGTPLADAKEVFRGQANDMTAAGYTVNDAQGDELTLYARALTIFESENFVLTAHGPVKLALPTKANIAGLLAGRLLVSIDQDWTPAGETQKFAQGSVLALKLSDVERDPAHLHPSIVFQPTADEFMDGIATTRDQLLLTTLKHVRGRAYVYRPSGGGWTHQALPVPDNLSVSIETTASESDAFFLKIEGFLTPTSLLFGDSAAGTLVPSRTSPAMFDASRDVVEQMEATSKDGTRVPYFIVHPKDMKYDGSNPTLLNAYGGFQISETPFYSATTGKLWLERGGVFVLANIRGGGEFGPAWHEAGLKTHRQRIYDDFAAVGEDLITRRVTSPRHLGILGGSNGGLLMGVEMEQHPELWNAVVIQVPLLDMLRFEHIAAGPSWTGEYGSVANPSERAFLASISPYQNLKPDVKYPEPLIFTSTKDDRVGPQHARKFAAKMEEYHLPFFYDEIIEGGHHAGANLEEQAQTWAVTYTYLDMKLMN